MNSSNMQQAINSDNQHDVDHQDLKLSYSIKTHPAKPNLLQSMNDLNFENNIQTNVRMSRK